MIKVINENYLIADYAVYNKVNSIEELVALTKVCGINFMAFGSEDIIIGDDLELTGAPTLRVEDYCDEESITYDSLDTIDRDTDKVTQWYLHCNENGFTPFWFVGLSYRDGFEITESKRTTLKSDLFVGQKVWFAYGNDICHGSIEQIVLTENNHKNTSYCEMFNHALVSEGVGFDSTILGLNNAHCLDGYFNKQSKFIDTLKNGYVVISPDMHETPYLTRLNDAKYIIRPIDKVFTKSPF